MLDTLKHKIFRDVGTLISTIDVASQKVVWTNGCFDLLHAGHVHSLFYARSLGDLLIVGLNSDSSVRQHKGDGRPIVSHDDRALLLAALGCVDAVILFDTLDPCAILNELRPQIFVKGSEYNVDSLPEAKVVCAYGGQVMATPMHSGISTTEIIRKIRS